MSQPITYKPPLDFRNDNPDGDGCMGVFAALVILCLLYVGLRLFLHKFNVFI